jgi:peptidoglycan hydrolase CwlO-like protein
LQELKKKELDELDAIFSELGISTEEKAAQEAAAEKKKKKKEKKKGNGEAENGSSSAEQQQQQQPAAAPEPEPEPAAVDESGESVDPVVVSVAGWLRPRQLR